MGSISSDSLCIVAKDMFFASTPFIPEAFFCAMTVDDGKGNSEAINKAAEAWGEASKQLREFHDELAGVVHSVPDSEWKAADREAYEQEANKYLEQVTTSATAAETASVLLYAVEAALYVFAAFALAEATIIAANAAAIAVADCTIVGAPEAEAEGLAVGAEAYEALEAAAKVLLGAFSTIAAGMEAGVMIETGVQAIQGDNAALGNFGQATLQGAKADVKLLPNEIVDYAKGRALKGLHDGAFPDGSESGGSGDSGADGSSDGSSDGASGDAGAGGSADTGTGTSTDAGADGGSGESGNADGGHSGESGSDDGKSGSDGSDGSDKNSWVQPVGNESVPKQIRSLFPEAPQ